MYSLKANNNWRMLGAILTFVMLALLVGVATVYGNVGTPARDDNYMNNHSIVIEADSLTTRAGTARAGGVSHQIIRNPDGSVLELIAGRENFTATLLNSDGSEVFTREVPFELPIFGAFFSGTNYNFAAFGQRNMDERTDVEVFRIVRYDKQWNRIDDLRLFGGTYGQFGFREYGNTTNPFAFGIARFAEYGDMLLLHGAREMYAGRYLPDGTGARHQRSFYIFIDIPTMTLHEQMLGGWAS